ncbi:MAG TPA: hypothetical protein VGL67_07445, partial [Casimicrobiaceae bacterium]
MNVGTAVRQPGRCTAHCLGHIAGERDERNVDCRCVRRPRSFGKQRDIVPGIEQAAAQRDHRSRVAFSAVGQPQDPHRRSDGSIQKIARFRQFSQDLETRSCLIETGFRDGAGNLQACRPLHLCALAQRQSAGGTMIKRDPLKVFAISTVGLLGVSLSTSIASATGPPNRTGTSTPATASVPKAQCSPGDRIEGGLQGQTTPQERASGDSALGYNCNLDLVGQFRGDGALSQNGPTYFGDCAYYATA